MKKKNIFNIALGVSALVGSGYALYRLSRNRKTTELFIIEAKNNEDEEELRDFSCVKRSYFSLPRDKKEETNKEYTKKAM